MKINSLIILGVLLYNSTFSQTIISALLNHNTNPPKLHLVINKPNQQLIGVSYIQLNDPYKTNGYHLTFEGCDSTQHAILDTTLNTFVTYPFKFFVFTAADTLAGCSYPNLPILTDSFILEYPNSIQNIATKSEFEIFPNPTRGIFHIEFLRGTFKDAYVSIYSLTGQLVYNCTLSNRKSTHTVLLPNGTYIVSVLSGSKHYYDRLIINSF